MKKILIPLLAFGGALALQPALAEDGDALYKTKGCTVCHAVDSKLVGPSYKDVAAKYAGQADAVDVLAAKIKNGGSGNWGQIPMPPNAVTEEEAKALAKWVLEQK
ncbi:c-type cytochrome [Azotobacter chroococcum subsp. isscasi]|uniref:Cytochrome c-551 n=1 Tax=Azotobacter chroococcum NCIMB 8003 TaxID=1328314 RepID=A0A0C4WIR5_9GAMM|nr:c-type cytochrome [Azotobacter chroococcum]AJE19606.1 Cytochrome C biogenesis protein CcsA [Azotobacter chroococcum NCIMB 8003]MEE4460966.1 c-type cytochrome [Azotobacter chroococcum]TBW12182.1 c-type cytochrome [Azotobacter chroococcum subsp. isscasi]